MPLPASTLSGAATGTAAPSSPISRVTELRRVIFTLCGFLSVLGIFWIIFYVAWSAFPYVRAGADVVFGAKAQLLQRGPVFAGSAPHRVIIFGNSKVLSGFKPELFDQLSNGSVYSYNMGIPDRIKFIPHLKTMIARGEVPTDILITMPWPAKVFHPTIFAPVESDDEIATMLFPFRNFPRDSILFFIRARSRGGVRAFYAEGANVVDQMKRDRGYYFIEGQSHYPGNRLPDDFALDTDKPNVSPPRGMSPEGEAFADLDNLLKANHIKAYIVPLYFREHELAPAAPNDELVRAMRPYPEFTVLGPDYFRFPNRYFSDHTHLNPNGADFYTRKLWELVGPMLK